jgi:Clp amino terminal domain, pathogenicity island component
MNDSGSDGGKVFGRFAEPAHRVLDLARDEAERGGHRYLGPEHVLLGLLAESHSRAAQVLSSEQPRSRAGTACGKPSPLRLVGPSDEPTGTTRFIAAYLLEFGLIAALITLGPPSTGPSTKTPAMVDPRVTHLWDTDNVVGQEFLERFGADFGGLDYDFFLLFDRVATWGPTPPRPVSSGATVIGDSDRLAEGAAALLR